MIAARRVAAENVLVHLFLSVTGALMLVPFAWMVLTAFKDYSELFAYPPRWIPERFLWENFKIAWGMAPFGRFYLNSTFVTTAATGSQVVLGALAAYAFARLQFPGREVIFVLFLSTLIVPVQATMVPLFVIMSKLGWIDTYQGLIVPFAARAFPIFFLRQFFLTIPNELEDAATIDGCGRLRFLRQIMLPLARPALGAITLFTFLHHWSDYVWPLIVTNSTSMRTLPVGLRYFISQQGSYYHYMMAAGLIVMLPVLALFFAMQRQFIKGVVMTGLKG